MGFDVKKIIQSGKSMMQKVQPKPQLSYWEQILIDRQIRYQAQRERYNNMRNRRT
jgi:hypothetical protein